MKIGGVTIGRVAKIDLDPVKLDSVLTLDIDQRYKDLPGRYLGGHPHQRLLGESFVGLSPGGDRKRSNRATRSPTPRPRWT